MSDYMKFESNRQDLASRLVDREIYYCMSSLVGTLSTLALHCDWKMLREECISWEEDILPLMETYDIEQAGIDHINECEDLDELERMVDLNGYWSDACAQAGFDSAMEYADSDGEMSTINFDEWFDGHCTDDEKATVLGALRTHIIDQTSDWDEFCTEFEVDYRDDDTYRREVYEHWLVSGWLLRKLAERGEVTGELCGLTIWGRCCTGQAICLDHVMQQIAMETWPDDVLKKEDLE